MSCERTGYGQGRRAGFSITEVTAASFIMLMVVAMTMSGFIYALQAAHQGNTQDELDVNVQKAMERLKRELRLSTLDEMFFYKGSTVTGVEYDAISFPMARDDDADGAIETNAAGLIEWDQTVIYHVAANPFQLKMTTIDPRDNNWDDALFIDQLSNVVVTGGTNSGPTNTITIFENLFTWSINKSGTPYNGYADSLSRKETWPLGAIVLKPGSHTIKFSVMGKDGSGYHIGIDSLQMTPSRSLWEGEGLWPAVATNGPAPAQQWMLTNGTWSGDYQLYFPATATGQYFKLSFVNDQWKETNFRDGQTHSNVLVYADGSYNPTDRVVQLEGPGTTWATETQSGSTNPVSLDPAAMRGAVVRILLRGDLDEEGGMEFNGKKCKLSFRSGTAVADTLWIDEAYIARAASDIGTTVDATGAQFGMGSPQFGGGTNGWTPMQSFEIDKRNSYVVSFRIRDDAGHASTVKWPDATGKPVSCWVSPNGAGQLEPDNNTWSSSPASYHETNGIIALQEVYTTYPVEGIYESQVFDTHMENPTNIVVNWSVVQPSSSLAELRVRSWDSEDMTDAVMFESTNAVALPYAMSSDSKRYLQFRASLYPSPDTLFTPKVRDVTFTWSGEEVLTKIDATYTTGPSYGKYLVFVDDLDLVRSLTINLEIFKDTMGFGSSRRITSSLTAEVQPRNTGK